MIKRNHQGRAANIDWNYCFICQRKQKTIITNSDETLKTLYEFLKTNNACFHRNCGTKYNHQKLERFTKKRDNAEQPVPSVRRSSVKKRDFAAVFCAICNQTDSRENLHAGG